jgi:signal transduction histidine kinase
MAGSGASGLSEVDLAGSQGDFEMAARTVLGGDRPGRSSRCGRDSGTRWPYHPSGLAGEVRRTGHAERVEDYSRRRGAFAANARDLGLYSIAGAPIIVDGAVWGLATIASTDGPLPDRTEDRLAEFTELVGTAVANTQSRTELSASRARIVAAADETRRRLEHDLHDGIQQRLVSLALKARMIETMTPQPANEIQGELSLLADGLGTVMDELREISHGIHPAVLSESGLGPALEALARRSAVPVELELNLRHWSRTKQPAQTAIAAAASRRALPGSILTGNHSSGSRPLSTHRAYLATRAANA